VTAVSPATGAFEVRIDAFEDAGARWELVLHEITRFQFAAGAAVAEAGMIAALQEACTRGARPLMVDADPAARAATEQRLAAARAEVTAWLAPRLPDPVPDLAGAVQRREGDSRLFALLEDFLAGRGVSDLERALTATLASNPNAGEVVKGHAIVLAELGLCPYRGTVVRDLGLFSGAGARSRRAEHLIARLAFTQQLWRACGHEAVTLYRGAATDGPLPAAPAHSLVSATFSSAVAEAHFTGGPASCAGVLWRQRLPLSRLLMTFLETRAFSGRFHEAEAVLIADPGNRAF
jgi:hypothetical protein